MKTRTSLTVPVGAELNGASVQAVLRTFGFSRHLLIQLKKVPGAVLLDGIPVYLIERVRAGQEIWVSLAAVRQPSTVEPASLPLCLVYEDEDILVADKPAGMPVHPSQGHHEDTLCNALAWHSAQDGEAFSAHPIGRLDRDTSGLVLFARHELSACILSDAMHRRAIRREYRAVCTGLLPESGTISAPIARAAGSTIARVVSSDGDPAVTHFQRLSYQNGYSLAAVRLESGRTHQIRVHMKYLGYPLPGDFLYNPDYSAVSRQALHSYQLSFSHPINGHPIVLTADMPEDMQRLLR